MDDKKYARNVELSCPTCGSTHYLTDGGVDHTIQLATCASCGRSLTKDELLQANSENLHQHAREIGEAVVKDFADEFRRSLKDALRGSKHIKIK